MLAQHAQFWRESVPPDQAREQLAGMLMRSRSECCPASGVPSTMQMVSEGCSAWMGSMMGANANSPARALGHDHRGGAGTQRPVGHAADPVKRVPDDARQATNGARERAAASTGYRIDPPARLAAHPGGRVLMRCDAPASAAGVSQATTNSASHVICPRCLALSK